MQDASNSSSETSTVLDVLNDDDKLGSFGSKLSTKNCAKSVFIQNQLKTDSDSNLDDIVVEYMITIE